MSPHKSPVQQLVEEWLSLDEKRDLRDATYSWLRLTNKPRASIPPENNMKPACPEKEEVVPANP